MAVAVGLIVLASALALTVYGARRRDAVGMWTAWTAAFYLPAANLIAIYPVLAGRALFMPEHNLYAPLAGLGLLSALGIEAGRRRAAAPLRTAAVAVAIVVLLALAVRTTGRVFDWVAENELFGSAVAAGSLSPRVWFNYGNTLLERRHFGAAAEVFAVARQQAGDLDGAADAYAHAIRLQPDDAQLFENLGSLALRRGDRGAARTAFARALQLDPQLERSRRALAALAAGTP
jgi:tetratricopeptide (TPR) repeat protein